MQVKCRRMTELRRSGSSFVVHVEVMSDPSVTISSILQYPLKGGPKIRHEGQSGDRGVLYTAAD